MDFNLILRMSKDTLRRAVKSLGYSKQSTDLSELLANEIRNYDEMIELIRDKDILRRKCNLLLQNNRRPLNKT